MYVFILSDIVKRLLYFDNTNLHKIFNQCFIIGSYLNTNDKGGLYDGKQIF